jgi:uncharacterized protein
MDMKDAEKKAHYFQTDNKITNIIKVEGVEILPSSEAWKKYPWTNKYFSSKPSEGYFVWIKKQIDFPLMSYLLLASYKAKQNLQNLVVIEKGLKISLLGSCISLKEKLCGIHRAQGKIVLKEGSFLDYRHSHSWGREDTLDTDYKFLLGKRAHLSYLFNFASSPGRFNMKNEIVVSEKASCDFNLKGVFNFSKGEMSEKLVLKGKDSSGQIRLRMAVKEKSKIFSYSEIKADNKSKGHLDCQGLLIEKGSTISLEPVLNCNSKEAQITHEASVGKISEEQLNYLRMRGLSEKKALNLIVNGFLDI